MLILDLNIGGTDGIQVMQHLRAEGFHLPVLILTVSEAEEDMARALRNGANGYLLKSMEPDEVVVGIDGCSAPNFAVPLRNAALAFARLCDPVGLSEPRSATCRLITSAMTTHPDMIGGSDNFDTLLMQAIPGKVLCKGGAEGYQALAILPGALGAGSPGLGIAFKISDGDLKGHNRPVGDPRGRVRPPVTLEILRQLGAITKAELQRLEDFGPAFPVENWRKVMVGWGAPCFTLSRDL